MNSSGRSTLQDLFSTLQSAHPNQRGSDQVAFTSPYTGSLVRQSVERNGHQFVAEGAAGTPGIADEGVYPEDMNKLARQNELAFSYCQRIRPNGDPKPYLAFVSTLKKNFLRQKKRRPDQTVPDAAKDGQRRNLAKGEKDQDQPDSLSDDPSNRGLDDRLQGYPEELWPVLKIAFGSSDLVTEQYNMLNYASASLELDAQSLKRRIGKAERSLEALEKAGNPEDQPKIERRKLKLEAFRRDADTTANMIAVLQRAMAAMKEQAGQQIDDGFNILPKSFSLLAEIPHEEGVTGEELAEVYREEILQFTDVTNFFETFLNKHREIGFKKYLRLSLQLLGSDIISANPSRNPNQLKAIRDGIYMAQLNHQIFERIGRMDRQYDRMLALREKAAGTYQPHRLAIQYDARGLTLAMEGNSDDPNDDGNFLPHSQLDQFEDLTEIIGGHNVDEIVFTVDENLPAADQPKMESTLRTIRYKYGLPIRRTQVESPLPFQEATAQQLSLKKSADRSDR